jgi:hypothetical protein
VILVHIIQKGENMKNMQDTADVTHKDSERRTSHGPGSCPGARPIKRFGEVRPKGLAALLICLLTLASVALAQGPQKAAAVQSDAQKALNKMKPLAGSWQGTIRGISINFTIRAVSSDTAILEEGNTSGGGPPNHEITMFYLDGDRLLATHYCDAGNRSRLEGKMSPDGKAIEFSFLDVTGSTRGGYLKDMVITMIDVDHHIVEFTFVMPDGKPIPLRGEFQRDK